ncbi:hypothetical protein [Phormidium sp. CCY1219]|uniref:hypothetical protein n=1 Tax=Phormidium sp. CCY1219 TaxID=2886104 RepID=UPI002D1E7690|nr:hypothetical protein [Phormidium sp. CCY1219]MEB3826604.1 hypothetical protein [Phormidium sp. CCY1219]
MILPSSLWGDRSSSPSSPSMHSFVFLSNSNCQLAISHPKNCASREQPDRRFLPLLSGDRTNLLGLQPPSTAYFFV